MITSAHVLHSANINGTAISNMITWDHDDGSETFMEKPAGVVDATFVAQKSHLPTLKFSTANVGTALGVCGINGLTVDSTPAADFYFQQLSPGGGYLAAGYRARVNSGLLVPQSLSAGHDKNAEISYTLTCLSDGTNNPIVFSAVVAVPTGLTADQYYVAGPCIVNGVLVTGIQNIEVDFGIKPIHMGGDGEVFSTFSGYTERNVKVKLKAINMPSVAAFGLQPFPQIADTILYLRKVKQGGGREDIDDNVHIQLTINSAYISVKGGQGKTGDTVTAEFDIFPMFDGTNAPIVISTAAEIVLP